MLLIVDEMAGVLVNMWAMSSRLDIVRRLVYLRTALETACRVPYLRTTRLVTDKRVGAQATEDIDPGDRSNINFFVAFELTQAVVQSFWLNASAS